MSAVKEFDVGPLTWVKSEIDQALERARSSLVQFAENPSDGAALKFCLTHLHQVTGALQMVGLDGLARFSEEFESTLAALEKHEIEMTPASLTLFNRAIAALTRYLEDLISGEPNVPLRLFPLYRELFMVRGSALASETDLFFPDLGAQAPKLSSSDLLNQGANLVQFVKIQRSAFQRGLLRWLRDSEDADAKHAMLEAVRAIEGTQPLPAQRSFWWSAVGLIDALVHHGLEPDFELKRLCARIDLQVRRLGSGSPKVAERLLRDVLYSIARSKPSSGRAEEIKRLFQLDRHLPPAGVNSLVEVDLVKMRPILRELREILTSAKDAWTKCTSGNRPALAQFVEALARLKQKSSDLSAPLLKLLDVMQPIAADMESVNDSRRDELGLEIATALLVVENALDNITNPKADIARQVGVMVGRLRSAVGGKARDDDLLTQPVLDEISRKAQEKLLVAQVVREIQSNLRHIEQVLDTFFRDPAKRDALPGLQPFLKQVAGALAILRLEEATELLNACQALINKAANPAHEVAQAELELLADGLSSLGFYIEAIEHNPSEPLKIIAPVFSRLTGKTLSGPDITQTIELPGNEEDSEAQAAVSVESDLAISKQQTQALFEAWQQQPEDTVVREELQNQLESMRQDADLVADKGLHERTAAALNLLNTAENGQPGLAEAISRITAPKVAAVAPSAQATRLLVASSDAVDAELLEIYLEEAAEVLATIEENLAICRAQPHQRDAITTIRRGFHTLKGSGRMVGLMQLGEIGWSVEQVMNEWQQQDKLPNAALFNLIALAHDSFAVWVTKLKNAGSVEIEAQPIHDLAAQLRDGVEPAAVAVATHAPIASPAVVFAPAAAVTSAAAFARAEAVAPAVAIVAAAAVSAAPSLEEYTAKKLNAGPAAEAEDIQTDYAAGEVTVTEIAPQLFATPETADQPVEASTPDPEPEPLATDIQIGDIVMSAELYEIFMKEAEQHLVTLEREAAKLHELPQQPIAYDFMRAAHTLAGISRTAGVAAVVETACALELYLQELTDQPVAQNTAQITVIDNAVIVLRAMMHALSERRAPEGADPEMQELRGQLAVAREQHRPAKRASAAKAPEHEIDIIREVPTADAEQNPLDLAASDLVSPDFLSADLSTDDSVSSETPPAELASADLSEIDLTAIDMPASGQTSELPALDLPALDLLSPSAEATQSASEISATEQHLHDSTAAKTSMDAYPTAAESERAASESEPVWPVAEALPEQPAALAPVAESPVMEPAGEPMAEQSVPEVMIDKAPLPRLGPAEGAPAIVERRVVRDDIDVQLLPIFIEEAADLVPQIGSDLRAWKSDPANTQAPLALRRALHTLKGGARMAGAMRLGELTHYMESQVDHALATSAGAPTLFDDLESEFDRVNDAIERLQRNDFLVVAAAPAARAANAPPPTAATAAEAQIIPIAPLAREADHVSARALLRVRADIVDRLVNDAGEVSIARSRIDGEVRSFKHGLNELTDSVLRLRGQLREVEIQAESQLQSRLTALNQEDDAFDPLEFDRFTRFQELTRLMAESLHDVTTVQQTLLKSLDEADAALLQQARMNRELQQELMRIRTVPFSSLSERLYRIMRLTAKELGKKANLEIRGGNVELDRSVLEKIGAPLEHMLRNAIAHGLEDAGSRTAAGKTEIGEITLDVRQHANEILIVLSDDGRGLDLARIRGKVEAAGLLQRDTEATETQLMEFIFMPGFSTAEEITQTSGRGIGMEVARNEIATLGGRVEVASQAGKGTTFSIYLPLTLAVTQIVLIRVGTRHYAVPSSMIEQVQELKAPALAVAYKDNKIEWHGNSYPFHYLPRLLGDMDLLPEAMRYSPILLLKSGAQRVAIHVDGLIGNQEIVVKNIGPQLARVAGIAGATVLGNGAVVLIINPVQLAQRDMLHIAYPGRTPALAANAEKATVVAPLIMVVDDSLTVRKVTGRLLAREGYQVVTAKDGVDALKQLQDMTPDVMLVDIEMPRMDGFDLTKNVRADPITARVPIIMITSRTADKHRNHAKQLGVDVFLGKPFQEADLLHHIERFTKKPQAKEIEGLARAG
ncbi:MAG: Hpt domain-containing protein [Burkholderiales bacterium]|nr:Hpt domain-containing protein [Burkholderiales bacterium]